MNTVLIKPISIISLISLLVACGGSSLPEPTPLTSFPASASLQKVWSTHPNDGNDELLFKLTPAYQDNTLYVAGNDGNVSALNVSTGTYLWSQRYKNWPFSSNLALTEKDLYLGTDNGEIVKLNRANGEAIWVKTVPSTVMAAPVTSDKAVFAKTINGEVTALNPETGLPTWNYQQTLPSLILRDASNPVIKGNLVMIGFSNGGLIAFDQSSGNIAWVKQVSLPEGKTDVERMADIAATPKVLDDTVYASAYQGKLIAFNLLTQNTVWTADVSTYNDFALSKEAVFVGDTEGNVLAIDRSTGVILWKQDALRYRYLTAPVYIGHNLLAIADNEGYLHVLSAKDGHFVARVSVNSDGIITSPLFIKDLIIVQTNKGRLYAYKILPDQS